MHTLVTRHKPAVLQEMETTYEDRGLTFYDEPLSRKTFSGMFGKGRVAFRYGLKPRTAASVSAAAWKGWRDWFGHKEQPRLDRLRALSHEP
ncbi:MAG: hypothetical protein HY760_09160 [Nitrospirae bacterium]|nr:hypothetical protein [Nitrospirota bacterium]